MLAAWSRYQRTRAKRTIVADASLRSPFTWQSGLLPALTGQPRIGGSVVNAVLQPTMFSSESELAGVGEYIEALGISNDEHSLAATYVIEDLARNVFHHASTHGGGAHVAARYDLNDQTLRVGVADCGKGIPSDIRENLGESIGDIEAVTAAMEPEISGSAQPGVNRGVGLYFIRRLALASRGALWLKTGRVLVDIAPRTPDTISVQPVLAGEEWQGCAVGVMLRLEEFDNFQQILEAIRSDLDHQRSNARQILFYKQDNSSEAWVSIVVEPDSGGIATDRNRARALAAERIAPILVNRSNVSLNFTQSHFATQAFCHALLVGICEQFGTDTLKRVRFIGCTKQVMTVVRMALEYGMRQEFVPERPESS